MYFYRVFAKDHDLLYEKAFERREACVRFLKMDMEEYQGQLDRGEAVKGCYYMVYRIDPPLGDPRFHVCHIHQYKSVEEFFKAPW